MGEFEVSLFDEDVVKIITLDQQSEFFLNFRYHSNIKQSVIHFRLSEPAQET